jgi:tRNA A-37 threonylcarbamoyl transferase component Bud32
VNSWPGGWKMPDDPFESRILGFEQSWQQNGRSEIADFLDRPPALASPERWRLLLELICIDLEFRWRNGPRNLRSEERLLLESYAARFPELGPLDQLPLELIGEEYRVRRLWGDRPAHGEFLARFHARQEEIRAELVRVDRELEEEAADSGSISPPSLRVSTTEDQALDLPLFSDRDILLRRMIGAGRTGKVYQAWQHSSSREIAVKFLRKSLLHQRGVVERFVGEARTIAKLRHPNIVGIHGLGRTPGGSCFLIMDLVDGPNLAILGKSRTISVGEATRWAIQMCQALEHAHARGIIHCDLKPANILLDDRGSIRVTDFGLARSLTEQTPWTAEIEGTAPFMAPEQASRCWGPIDTRTDIYGVGAVLYTLLTGRPPWVGRRLPDILADVVSAATVVPATSLRPDLPGPIVEICRKCLSKPPEDRYRTVQDLRAALIGSLTGER